MLSLHQTSLCQEDYYVHGQKKRIWGNICLFFADGKISEGVYKICSFVNYVTLYVLFVYEEVHLLQLKPM